MTQSEYEALTRACSQAHKELKESVRHVIGLWFSSYFSDQGTPQTPAYLYPSGEVSTEDLLNICAMKLLEADTYQRDMSLVVWGSIPQLPQLWRTSIIPLILTTKNAETDEQMLEDGYYLTQTMLEKAIYPLHAFKKASTLFAYWDVETQKRYQNLLNLEAERMAQAIKEAAETPKNVEHRHFICQSLLKVATLVDIKDASNHPIKFDADPHLFQKMHANSLGYSVDLAQTLETTFQKITHHKNPAKDIRAFVARCQNQR